MELYFSKEFYTNYLISKCRKALISCLFLNVFWFTLVSALIYLFGYKFNGTLEFCNISVVVFTVFWIVSKHFEFKRLRVVFFGTLTKQELSGVHNTLFKEFYVRLLITNFAETMVVYTTIVTLISILLAL